MKHLVIIPDGGADLPMEHLGGRTPMQAARQPHLAAWASRGVVGRAATTPKGFEAGSDVCSMSLLGYDPAKYHTGRAPLEAAALGLDLTTKDWIFRLNFVTTGTSGADEGKMLDHSAGAITDAEARDLVRAVSQAWRDLSGALAQGFALHPGVSYRNILVDSSGADYQGLVTTPPHEIPGKPWRDHLPRGNGSDRINRLMTIAADVLRDHPVNRARIAAGKRPATMAWVWGQGTKPTVPAFHDRFGKRGAMITSVDLLRGIAAYIGWDRLEVAGLTSYHDTDYAAQGRATIDALRSYDVVCCHVESPDEASHQADWKTKVAALEAIDEKIIAPVAAALEREWPGAWRVLVQPDHYTLCSTRKHDATPVPFLVLGAGLRPNGAPFTEAGANASPLQLADGHDLMGRFLDPSWNGAP
jgi:2,3-bisphosphoglycerate-independent phosphoglycerate mutase